MPVPPPPPPPPAAPQALIPPPTNKNLLASIEKGTKLKKVPETAKHDRSSGLVAVSGPSADNHATRRVSQSHVGPAQSNPALNNSAIDFQSQLRNQLISMQTGSNGVQEKKAPQAVTYPSVRPALNQPLNKTLNNSSSPTPKPQSPLIKQGSSSNFPMSNSSNTNIQQNQRSNVINRVPPPSMNNKPSITRAPQPTVLANKPAPLAPNVPAARPQSYYAESNNSQPSQIMFHQTNNRPLSSSQDVFTKNRAPVPNQFHSTNNKPPAPNQPQLTNSRPPPPPPSKTKPLQRNSVSMNPKALFRSVPGDPIKPMTSGPLSSEPMLRPRPQSQAPPIDISSRQSSNVTRTTANPPPPVPGPFRLKITHDTSLPLPPAPPLPSRVNAQSLPVNNSTSQPYKVADRAPPPPPPGGHRASVISIYSAFDSRFTFPSENQFPRM